MSTAAWATAGLLGLTLVVAARHLGSRAWRLYGKPYAFASQHYFIATYAFAGSLSLILSTLSLSGVADLDPRGLPVIAVWTELGLRSRQVGSWHWQREKSIDRETYQRLWLAVSAAGAMVGLLMVLIL